MFDELHAYYNRELGYLRKLAGEFAEQHPKIAGRLRLSGEAADDPHVERLLQGFAFIAARIHRKLDDDFPELTQGLLEILYPHYLAPIPSMAVVELAARPDLASPLEVKPGTLIDAGPVQGDTCRFRTAYPVTLWPIQIEAVSLRGRPIVAPANPAAAGAAGVLRLSLRCAAEGMTLSQLAPERLRFFIRPQSPHAYKLYETILNHSVSIALADHPADPAPVICSADSIRAVGFDAAELLLPYPMRSFLGYRLLTEYFAFPEKFLFFDLTGLAAKSLVSDADHLEVFIYLNRTNVELERAVSAESLALGCTPIVNLFRQRAEPIRLDNLAAEYRVVADARRVGATEVYAIEFGHRLRARRTGSYLRAVFRPALGERGRGRLLARGAPHRRERRRRHRGVPVLCRRRFRPGGAGRLHGFRRDAVPQSRPAVAAAVRRREPAARAGRGIAGDSADPMHHAADANLAAATRARHAMAADLASGSQSPVDHRRRGWRRCAARYPETL